MYIFTFGILLAHMANASSNERIYEDSKSALEWQGLGEQMYSWKDAQKACVKLGKEWRLPSKADFEKNRTFVAALPIVKNRPKLSFWSTTKYEKDNFEGGRAYAFYQGKMEPRDQDVDGVAVFPIVCARPIKTTAKQSAAKLEKIEANQGDTFAITVKNLGANLDRNDKKWTSVCSNQSSWIIQFPKGVQLALTCGQAYGGIVRLHNPGDLEPHAGVIVGNDWGDEGCFESTSSKLEVMSTGSISLMVSTEFGGEHVDEGKNGCKHAKEEQHLVYDVSKRAFQKK